MEELRNCLCGGEVEIRDFFDIFTKITTKRIFCLKCGRMTNATEENIKFWNTRPEEDRLNERIEELETKNKEMKMFIEKAYEFFEADIDIKDSVIERWEKYDKRIKELESLLSGAETNVEDLSERVVAFAGQLQAWEFDSAAEEVIKEILGGKVDAPDYYELKRKVEELEIIIQDFSNSLLCIAELSESWHGKSGVPFWNLGDIARAAMKRRSDNACLSKISELEAELADLVDKYTTLKKDYEDVCYKRLEAANLYSKQILELQNEIIAMKQSLRM